jgi:hypothetical protein
MNYPAGRPTPIQFGYSGPPLSAAQTQTQSAQVQQGAQGQGAQTLEEVLQNIQLQEGSVALASRQYTQGYLRTLLGKMVRVEFLIGENSVQDRTGVLLAAGIDYIILREIDTDDDLLCDAYAIKFVTEYR